MQEIEMINAELVMLGDMLARLENKEIEDAMEDELPLRQTIWKRSKDREEMKARFDFLNATLAWWREQSDYVFAHAKEQESGFQAPPSSPDGLPRSEATGQVWHSARSLLRKVDHYSLEKALKIWVDDLVRRGMLSPEDAAQVQFSPPHDEHLERKRAEDRERRAQFEADLQRVLDKVEEVAEKRGRHPGLPHRQALGIWNRRFNERYRDRQLLIEFIAALAREKLLPKTYAGRMTAENAIKSLLGG